MVFRGDIVKYDSGSYAVCTEQGSSASEMMAAQEMMSWKTVRMRRTRSGRNISLHPFMDDPVVVSGNLCGHILAELSQERQFEKVHKMVGTKRLGLSVFVDGTKLTGKKQNIDPMW